MKIAAYAFANTAHFFEALIAESKAEIEWSIILPRWHHRQRFSDVLPAECVCYLYEDFDRRYEEPDTTSAFGFPAGADSEFVCLAKDKGGYRNLDQTLQLRRAATITHIYRKFLERVRPDYLVFPDLEVVDGFLLLSLCRELGIEPIYYVGMRMLGGGFFASDCYERLPAYFGDCDPAQIAVAERCLDNFLAGKSISTVTPPAIDRRLSSLPLWQRVPRALLNHFRHESHYTGEDGWLMRIKANVAPQINRYRRWHFKRFQRQCFDIRSENDVLPERFVLYALQYTPESSINGLEPYYIDQSRAIDLLLAGLPSGYRLLVKEHPAIVGVRKTRYYHELRKKPGVVLVAPEVNTRRLIEKAAMVASVTGTVCLEAFLLGKPGILLGRNFFSHLCAKAGSPADMPTIMGKLLHNPEPVPRARRIHELARLLAVQYPILLSDPVVDPGVISRTNIAAFLGAMKQHIQRLAAATPLRNENS